MRPIGVYLFTVLTVSAGLLGHPAVLASMTHRAALKIAQRAAQGRRRADRSASLAAGLHLAAPPEEPPAPASTA